ncbi:MAG TPA: hypothetical protein VH249_19910 [Xanthobacteraceae bacterium]|nr:hypothetical protein [Xanthobacteraceae bacterium]
MSVKVTDPDFLDALSAQAEERKDRHDHHDQTDEINQAVHGLPSQLSPPRPRIGAVQTKRVAIGKVPLRDDDRSAGLGSRLAAIGGLAITSGTADGFSIRGAAPRHFPRVQT